MVRHKFTTGSKGAYTIDLSPANHDALRSLLAYFYTGMLDVPKYATTAINGPDIPSLAILVAIYTLAMEYQLPDLCIEAKRKFCAALSEWPKGHGELLAKALVATVAGRLEGLTEMVLDVAVKFAAELVEDKKVYALLEGEPLRALMLKMTHAHNRRDSLATETTKKRSTDAALKKLEGGSTRPTSSSGRHRTDRRGSSYDNSPQSGRSTASKYNGILYSPAEAPITGSIYSQTHSTASRALRSAEKSPADSARSQGSASPGSEQNSESGNDTPPAPTVESFRLSLR